MSYYKTNELIQQLLEIIQDGYQYVDVLELPGEDDIPTSLSFSALDDLSEIYYNDIFSCKEPEEIDTNSMLVNASDTCYHLLFTYEELGAIQSALGNSMSYFKELSKDKSLSREDKDSIRILKTQYMNLSAKLSQFLKTIRPINK